MVGFGTVNKDSKAIFGNGRRAVYDVKDIAKAKFLGFVTLADNKPVNEPQEHFGTGARNPANNLCALSQKGSIGYPTGSRAMRAEAHEIKTPEGITGFWFSYK